MHPSYSIQNPAGQPARQRVERGTKRGGTCQEIEFVKISRYKHNTHTLKDPESGSGKERYSDMPNDLETLTGQCAVYHRTCLTRIRFFGLGDTRLVHLGESVSIKP